MEFYDNKVNSPENSPHDQVHEWFQESAASANVNLSGFDPKATLGQRISWAISQGLQIGSVYTRFSSKHQHSTADQIRTCVQYGAQHGIYTPPEFIYSDEAVRGYKNRRQGLVSLLETLQSGQVQVVMVFKLSRLFRQAFKGYQWVQQEVVEMGLRAISVTQSIDTANSKVWKTLMQIHGMADDMMIEATSDHVRAGLKGLFRRGYTVGALPVGYRRKVVHDAPLTNRGLARTVPEIDHLGPHQKGETVDPEKPVIDVGAMIVRHYEMIRDGLPIAEGWKRWVEERGPKDPRSSAPMMTYRGYRNMLSRRAYIGDWSYCRKRNVYLTRKDYAMGVPQPESEVLRTQAEHLRIMDDDLFYAVQAVLATKGKGPRSRRKVKVRQLWDMVTDCFWCPYCNKRYYISGVKNRSMTCKSGKLCPHKVVVHRQNAVMAICREVCERIMQDDQLLQEVMDQVLSSDQVDQTELERTKLGLEQKLAGINRAITNLEVLAESVSDADQAEWVQKIRSKVAEREALRKEIALVDRQILKNHELLTPENVENVLNQFALVFQQAAEGTLGEESVHRAANLFRLLVNGRVHVIAEDRPGRIKKNVAGEFRLDLIRALCHEFQRAQSISVEDAKPSEVRVWLRPLSRQEQVAERVHELIDIEKRSMRETARILQSEGWQMNSGNVWYAYQRWYEMQGLEVPRNPYNNGHKRRDRKSGDEDMPMPPVFQP